MHVNLNFLVKLVPEVGLHIIHESVLYLRLYSNDSLTDLLPSLIMVALWNRADHYIFILWFLSSIFFFYLFSSPNLSGRRLDVYHTSARNFTKC